MIEPAAEHLLEGARREGPLHQRRPADAERVLEALVRAGAEAVEGDGKAGDSELGHGATVARSRHARRRAGRRGYGALLAVVQDYLEQANQLGVPPMSTTILG